MAEAVRPTVDKAVRLGSLILQNSSDDIDTCIMTIKEGSRSDKAHRVFYWRKTHIILP
jgi:hypothetical protein